jgi:hypothetical protein
MPAGRGELALHAGRPRSASALGSEPHREILGAGEEG